MEASTKRILQLFEQINAIPRCSKNERAISDWVVGWAADHGLECERDDVLNVLIRVDGTGEMGGAPPVALQGHLDMVCEKTPESTHNFDTDPIRSTIDGEWLGADQTTLGADDGIAVALALAIAEDDRIVHPPLELLFTVDEETGLTGAKKLSPDWLHSRILLNLDSEDEGVFTIGCAGGVDSLVTVPVQNLPADAELDYVQLIVSGLVGGHSGVDIHHDRANANILAARVSAELRSRFGAVIAEFHGGSARNAIPRDSRVVMGIKPAHREDALALVASWQRIAIEEYGSTDPSLRIALGEAKVPDQILDNDSAGRILDILIALPHGVIRMSRDVANLVETSTNLATVRTVAGKVEIQTTQRSSSESRLKAIAERIAAAARLSGASVSSESGYLPWEPRSDSALLQNSIEVYRDLYNSEPIVEIIHAGLECGVIGEKYPEMEMLSIGPTIQMPHSPDERLNLPSLERLWEFLVHLLGALR